MLPEYQLSFQYYLVNSKETGYYVWFVLQTDVLFRASMSLFVHWMFAITVSFQVPGGKSGGWPQCFFYYWGATSRDRRTTATHWLYPVAKQLLCNWITCLNCSFLRQLGHLVTVSDPLTATSSSCHQLNCLHMDGVLLLHLDQLCGTASPNTSETQHYPLIHLGAILKHTFLLDIIIHTTS